VWGPIVSHTVYHTGYRLMLNLSEEHLGHPELPGLWEQLHRHYVPGLLVCPESVAQRTGCPGGMYVKELDGQRIAAHYNPGVRHDFENESPEHLALKERVARVAESVGARATLEQRAPDGGRRTDVLLEHPTGGRIAWEVQRSSVTADAVLRRSRRAREDGLTPMWTTDAPGAKWIDRTPWSEIAGASWHVIKSGTSLIVRGGVKLLRPVKCSARPVVCPTLGRGRCDGYHAEWDLPAVRDIRIDLDELTAKVTTGQFVPLGIPRKRGGENWFWVPRMDFARYQGMQDATLALDLSAFAPATARDQAAKDLDLTCHYDGSATGVALAAGSGAATFVVPSSPRHRPVISGECGAGVTPCGAPARLYPCGWRCNDHSPGTYGAGGRKWE
jgi:hypothetical protein